MNYTMEKEAMGGGERNLHEMRVLKLAILTEIVNHRDSESFLGIIGVIGFELVKGLRTDFGAFRADGVLSLLPFPLQLGSSSV